MKLIDETYVCSDCGWKYTIWRRASNKRAVGHLKWLFCLKCNKSRNFLREEMFKKVVN